VVVNTELSSRSLLIEHTFSGFDLVLLIFVKGKRVTANIINPFIYCCLHILYRGKPSDVICVEFGNT
jgi:hypothetical protein